jgi:hypothetical protein
MLSNLASLYMDTHRIKESEETFKEALGIFRELAKANPAAYQPNVADTLNKLAHSGMDGAKGLRKRKIM